MPRRRDDDHPQWNGLVPEQLFARLDAEPVTGEAVRALGRALIATLDGRTAELVALRVAAVRGCAYVWAGHRLIAQQRDDDGRLTREEVDRIARDPCSFTGTDAAVLAAVDALLAPERSRTALEGTGSVSPLVLTTAVLFYDLVCTIMADAVPDAIEA